MMIGKQRTALQIKGIKEGLLITLGEGSWEEQQDMLLKHILEQTNFFQGARIALDVGNLALHAVDLSSLRDKLSDYQISLWAVLGNSSITEKTAQTLGLATRLSTPKPDRAILPVDTNLTGESAVLVRRTLRSGFKLAYQGHVVVIGDVNPGAEVIATGSVVVWGRLRGVVHAGAEGNENAVVCALDLSPVQLRIGNLIATTPQHKGKPQPEIAFIQEGQVMAELWNPRER
jgi:septum site-determining protein MinC